MHVINVVKDCIHDVILIIKASSTISCLLLACFFVFFFRYVDDFGWRVDLSKLELERGNDIEGSSSIARTESVHAAGLRHKTALLLLPCSLNSRMHACCWLPKPSERQASVGHLALRAPGNPTTLYRSPD